MKKWAFTSFLRKSTELRWQGQRIIGYLVSKLEPQTHSHLVEVSWSTGMRHKFFMQPIWKCLATSNYYPNGGVVDYTLFCMIWLLSQLNDSVYLIPTCAYCLLTEIFNPYFLILVFQFCSFVLYMYGIIHVLYLLNQRLCTHSIGHTDNLCLSMYHVDTVVTCIGLSGFHMTNLHSFFSCHN
jgi:hypothetical protein